MRLNKIMRLKAFAVTRARSPRSRGFRTTVACVLVAAFLSPLTAHAQIPGSEIDLLAQKLIMAESSGRSNAIGDGGKSRGLFQIHKNTWKLLTDRPFKDALNPEINFQIGMKLLHDINERYGKESSIMKIAYTFNTGRFIKSVPSKAKKHPNIIYRDIFSEGE